MAPDQGGETGSAALSRAIKGVAAIAALLPGMAMLVKVVPLPPTIDQMLGVVSTAFGAAMVIAVIALRDRISRLAPRQVAVGVLGCALVGSACLLLLFNFSQSNTRSYTDVDIDGKTRDVILVVPTQPSVELSSILEQFGGSYGEALHSPLYAQRVKELLATEASLAIAVLIALLVLAQAFLMIGLIAGAWRVADFFGPGQTGSKGHDSGESGHAT
jgi:hypothetical protein